MIAPFLAVFADAGRTVIDKIALSKRRIALKEYIPFLFLYLFFFTALAAPFLGSVNWQLLLTPTFLFLFLILMVLAVTQNIFYYESLRQEKLSEFETIIMLTPMITIMLSWIFFPETWNIHIGLAAIIAAAALIWSHWEAHHIELDHYSMNLLVAVVIMATEEIVAAELLRDQIFSPVGLYAFRTLLLTGFFFAYFRPDVKGMNRGNLNIIALSGLLGALFMVFKYYGYRNLGIPFTALVTIASPMAIYTASATVMHERMKAKVLIATAIVAVCIIYATALLQK